VLYTSKEPNADIKLVDFGLSSKFGKDKMHTIVGTCYYVAPEVLKQKYGPKCDVWSLGVIMYLLLAGKPPFVGKSKVEVFYKIRKSEYSLEGNVWDSISEEAKDLIRKLLTKSQKRRLSAVQALEHP
jgi:calcium-dependent protein kinase